MPSAFRQNRSNYGCWRSSIATRMPSRPREFHPEPLTDSGRDTLASSGSCHRMKAAAFRCNCRLLPDLPSWPALNDDDPPPSLHGHYPTSSLLRGSPPLSGALVLSASRLESLVLFP